MAERYTQKFRCLDCAALYEDIWDAQNCCEPETVFECEFCEETYYSERKAKECCVETDEENVPKAYLEEHGQERLF